MLFIDKLSHNNKFIFCSSIYLILKKKEMKFVLQKYSQSGKGNP